MSDFAEKYGIVKGVFEDVPAWEYHYGKYRKLIQSSAYSEIDRSNLHYKVWRDRKPPQPNTQAMDHFLFGNAYHTYVLQIDRFHDKYFPHDKLTRSTRGGKPTGQWKEVLEKAGKKEVLWNEDLETIKIMREALKQNKSAWSAITGPGRRELTLIWKDDFGIWCKARLDICMDAIQVITDLKSTADASPMGFGKSAANFGYPLQAGHYIEGAVECLDWVPEFCFIAQEKSDPYAAMVFQVSKDLIMESMDRIYALKQKLAEAFRTGEYKGYPDNVQSLEMPRWYYYK